MRKRIEELEKINLSYSNLLKSAGVSPDKFLLDPTIPDRWQKPLKYSKIQTNQLSLEDGKLVNNEILSKKSNNIGLGGASEATFSTNLVNGLNSQLILISGNCALPINLANSFYLSKSELTNPIQIQMDSSSDIIKENSKLKDSTENLIKFDSETKTQTNKTPKKKNLSTTIERIPSEENVSIKSAPPAILNGSKSKSDENSCKNSSGLKISNTNSESISIKASIDEQSNETETKNQKSKSFEKSLSNTRSDANANKTDIGSNVAKQVPLNSVPSSSYLTSNLLLQSDQNNENNKNGDNSKNISNKIIPPPSRLESVNRTNDSADGNDFQSKKNSLFHNLDIDYYSLYSETPNHSIENQTNYASSNQNNSNNSTSKSFEMPSFSSSLPATCSNYSATSTMTLVNSHATSTSSNHHYHSNQSLESYQTQPNTLFASNFPSIAFDSNMLASGSSPAKSVSVSQSNQFSHHMVDVSANFYSSSDRYLTENRITSVLNNKTSISSKAAIGGCRTKKLNQPSSAKNQRNTNKNSATTNKSQENVDSKQNLDASESNHSSIAKNNTDSQFVIPGLITNPAIQPDQQTHHDNYLSSTSSSDVNLNRTMQQSPDLQHYTNTQRYSNFLSNAANVTEFDGDNRTEAEAQCSNSSTNASTRTSGGYPIFFRPHNGHQSSMVSASSSIAVTSTVSTYLTVHNPHFPHQTNQRQTVTGYSSKYQNSTSSENSVENQRKNPIVVASTSHSSSSIYNPTSTTTTGTNHIPNFNLSNIFPDITTRPTIPVTSMNSYTPYSNCIMDLNNSTASTSFSMPSTKFNSRSYNGKNNFLSNFSQFLPSSSVLPPIGKGSVVSVDALTNHQNTNEKWQKSQCQNYQQFNFDPSSASVHQTSSAMPINKKLSTPLISDSISSTFAASVSETSDCSNYNLVTHSSFDHHTNRAPHHHHQSNTAFGFSYQPYHQHQSSNHQIQTRNDSSNQSLQNQPNSLSNQSMHPQSTSNLSSSSSQHQSHHHSYQYLVNSTSPSVSTMTFTTSGRASATPMIENTMTAAPPPPHHISFPLFNLPRSDL